MTGNETTPQRNEGWAVLGQDTILDHDWVQVHMQRIRLPDGEIIADWPIVHTGDFVNVMAVNELGQLLVLTGYKHGLGRHNWQVVGGYVEAGEDPLVAAQRELLEEAGLAGDSWQHLGSFVVDANRRVGTGHFYLARNVRQVAEPDADDLEAYAMRWVTAAELQAALGDGRVGVLGYAAAMGLGLLALGSGFQLG